MKKALSIFLALCLLSSFPAALAAPTGAATDDFQGMTLIGTALEDGKGSYLLPLRVVWEASGGTVTWEGNTKTIHVQFYGQDAFVFTVGSTIMELPGSMVLDDNGRKFDLGGPVVIIDSMAYAPAVNLSNYMGIKLNPETRGIYMTVMPAQHYTVYDGKNPLPKEELQKAERLTIINVDSLNFLRDAANLTQLKVGANDSPDPGVYGATVSGDIKAFSELKNLVSINLNNTKVTGDIGSLSTLTNLEEIYLNFTGVSGNISQLGDLAKLRVIALSSDNVSGSLSALKDLPALEYLNLSGKNITGDLSDLSGLSKLEYIGLFSTANVTGDISALKGLNLTGLSLIDTDITVDLRTIGQFTKLSYLGLRSPYVTGDISELGDLTALIQLMVTSPKVSGDISALAGMTNLVHVFLISPKVSGDIGTLGGLTNLMILSLASATVSGDIGALVGLVKLTYLDLSGTDVSGDLGSLVGLKNLMQVNVTGSKITGTFPSGTTN